MEAVPRSSGQPYNKQDARSTSPRQKENGHVFEKVGLGYRLELPLVGTELSVAYIRRSSGELQGELTVRSNWPGARTYDGILHASRMNLTSGQTRRAIGRLIAERIEGPKEDALDWVGFVDEFCTRIMAAERDGEPIETTHGASNPSLTATLLDPFLPAGMHTVLFGDGDGGKSLIAVAFAISLVSGHAVIPALVPHTTGPVLYLDWETDFATVDARQAMVSRGSGLTPQSIYYRRCSRPLRDIAEDIAGFVATAGVVLIIVDSMGMAIGQSERGTAEDATVDFYRALRYIGTTSLGVDRVAKGSDGTKPYGSVYRANYARATWFVKRTGEDPDGTIHVSLAHGKHNTTRKRDPVNLAIHWSAHDPESERIEFEHDPTSRVAARTSSTADRIEAVLRDIGRPVRVNEIARRLGVDHALVSRTLSANSERFTAVGRAGWSVSAAPVGA
jgi:hypothetical protein